jgi:hypothetical protein
MKKIQRKKKRESLGLHPQTSWVGNGGREVYIHGSHPLLVAVAEVVVRRHVSSSNPTRVFRFSLLCVPFAVVAKMLSLCRRRRRRIMPEEEQQQQQ